MKYLALSHHHGLHSAAYRLLREGHEVQVASWTQRFKSAWQGRLDHLDAGESKGDRAAAMKLVSEEAAGGELTVLSDFPLWTELLGNTQSWLFGAGHVLPWPKPPALGIVAWFDGEQWQAPMWAVCDWGAWPGGLGAPVLGGVTLVQGTRFPGVLDGLHDPFKASGWKGLVLVGLDYLEAAKELVPTGFQAGWPPLVTDAWLALVGNFGGVLRGEPPQVAPTTYTVALPVTQPPWPVERAPGPAPVSLAGLTSDVAKRCFFHDIQLRGGEVWTAGLDGMVAVAVGESRVSERARSMALAVAGALPLPQKQFRPDVGGSVPTALAGLEQLGYW